MSAGASFQLPTTYRPNGVYAVRAKQGVGGFYGFSYRRNIHGFGDIIRTLRVSLQLMRFAIDTVNEELNGAIRRYRTL